MTTRRTRILPATACLFLLASILAAALGFESGCTGRTAPVTGGPTSSGGSTNPAPPVNPAPPGPTPAPFTTRGAALDFERTPPTTPPGR